MRAWKPKLIHCHPTSKNRVSHAMSYSHLNHASKLSRPIQLILDFDGTLTRKDTMHIVANAGYKCQRKRLQDKHLPSWDEIAQAYMDDFSAHQRQYEPQKESRTTVEEELKWLNSLRSVEVASAERVRQAGIFDFVRAHDMEQAAYEALDSGQIELRPGWLHLLTAVLHVNQSSFRQSSSTNLAAVVSVNWSSSFVKNVLWHAARMTRTSAEQRQDMNAVEGISICANELPSIRNYTSIRLPVGELRTNEDKLKQLLRMRRDASKLLEAPLCIYLGDSTTDLGCLLAADLGICLRDEPMGSGQKDLAETCGRLEISVDRINDLSAQEKLSEHIQQRESDRHHLSPSRRLWYATSFEDIHVVLERLLFPT